MHYSEDAQIQIENSTLCGASCIMCPRDKFEHKLEIMPMDIFKKIVDEAVGLGIKKIPFTGFGDPLMDNYLKERFLYIKKKYPYVEISITTTAQLLEGDKLELVCEFVDIIKISNYGFSKKTYESIHRGSLIYEKIYYNIDVFLKRHKRPYTIMAFLDMPENHHEMEVWKNHYEPLADRIDIWKPNNLGGIVTVPLLNDSFAMCYRVLDLAQLSCRADGSVSICCMDILRQLVIGNIKTESLVAIINSDLVKKIQEMHIDGSILQSNYICKDCDQIRDRSDALVYINGNMQVGKVVLKKYKRKI